MLLKREFITKIFGTRLGGDRSGAGERKLLENRYSLDYTVCWGDGFGIWTSFSSACKAVGLSDSLHPDRLANLCGRGGPAGRGPRPMADSAEEELPGRGTEPPILASKHLLSDEHPAKEIRLFGLVPYLKGMAEELAERFYQQAIVHRQRCGQKLGFLPTFPSESLPWFWLLARRASNWQRPSP